MNDDAKFEDGVERPLRLIAVDAEDLQVLSALVQDAVFPASKGGLFCQVGPWNSLLARQKAE